MVSSKDPAELDGYQHFEGEGVLRRLKWLVLVVVVFAVGLGLFLLFQPATPQDVSPLMAYAETQSYGALIRAVQERPVPEEGFRFVALGDTRSNINIARKVLTRVVEESPAFILSNGDIVRRGRVEEYIAHHLRLVEQVAPTPFIPAPGNHEEDPNGDFATFEALYNGQRFSFDYGNCRFVGINNGDRNGMSGSDLAFLERELSKDGAAHKFVVFHVPPRFLENAVESEEGRGFWWNAKKLRRLMTAMHVDHVFMGHVHGYASEVVDGVRYTITGGAGASLTDNLGNEGRVHNFVVVRVTPDGVRNEVVRLINGEWVTSEVK